MPEDPLLPPQVVIPDPSDDFCDILKNPSAALNWFSRHLGVDVGRLQEASAVIVSPSEPGPGDRDKLLAKNSTPTGVGIYANGKWNVIYEYPPNAAVAWVGSDPPPAYLSVLTNSEKTDIGFNTSATVVALKT